MGHVRLKPFSPTKRRRNVGADRTRDTLWSFRQLALAVRPKVFHLPLGIRFIHYRPYRRWPLLRRRVRSPSRRSNVLRIPRRYSMLKRLFRALLGVDIASDVRKYRLPRSFRFAGLPKYPVRNDSSLAASHPRP